MKKDNENPDYPLACSTWGDEELAAISRVVNSGLFSMGNEVCEFEKYFSSTMGCKYAVMVNSGSSANLLMIAALFFVKENALKRGDEVIVPAVSWSTTYFPLQQYGLKLKFVDVCEETLNYDLEQLSATVSESTKVIFAVNLLGNPNDFEEINRIIGESNITLLEDNCESMGASFQDRKTGTFGIMGSFSTFFSHHISTMEGGVIVTDDEELLHILLSLRAHGWTRDLPEANRICEKSSDGFFEPFRFILPGYNVRPLEISAAIGIEQLNKLHGFLNVRRENADRFKTLMQRHDRFSTQKEIGHSSWFGFAIICEDPIVRESLTSELKRFKIDFRPIVAGNFAKSEAIKYFDYEIAGELAVANKIHASGIMIGNHHFDLTEQLKLLDRSLTAF